MKIKTALLCAAAVFLGGAGIVVATKQAPSQQLPDPNDVSRINEIAESLGTTRSYNRETLLANPEPDGLVLRDFMHRRERTLSHTLRITELPAPSNVTTVQAALTWERASRDGDTNELSHYELDVEQARGSCPQRFDQEQRWYADEEAAHARGERTSLIDWKAASAKFKAECAAENTGTRDR